MADYFEREINCHIKIEMLKRVLMDCPDWNSKAAYNLIDSQRSGYISHPQIYAYMKTNCKYDASDEELIAIVRRIDSGGDGKL